ncbi:unnamed protein product [Colias eurytheme]|nr:unnamed protein product [Colias eurytheme]
MAVADSFIKDETELTPEHREMKRQMRKLWANFITTGMPVPNATEFPMQTSQGPVQGYLDANGEVFEFFGIPYAKAPTNTEKFKAPLPPDTWDDIYEATNDKIICPQADYNINIPEDAIIVEDCLVANVLVPKTIIENAPVLVIVHGDHCAQTMAVCDTFAKDELTPEYREMKRQIRKLWANFITTGMPVPNATEFPMQTSQGPVRGYLDANGEVFEFFGIPYAKAPTNTEKFKAPLPPDTWDDIYEATNNQIVCPQDVDVMFRSDSTFLMSPCVEREIGQETFLTDSPVNILKSEHCAQTMAVADSFLRDETELTPEHREMKRQIRKLWANFITTGMPVPNATEFPSWPAFVLILSVLHQSSERVALTVVMWRYLITLFFAAVSISHGLESRVVDTEQGPVRGYKDSDVGIFAFYGVPYAKAPTGRLRFKAPLPAIKRTGIFDAVTKDIACPQLDLVAFYKRSLLITENCLIANIYVPDTTTKNLPVVVYVHGGGYVVGFGNLVTYNNLVKTKEVIVVTFNYRIGAHGFLCLGTEDIPGNAGMKDQVALLRWVQKNIKNFGGNPEDVTIAGYSAGSSSVDLLMLSKMTKGLFTKVIPESGANTAAWSVQTDPIAVAKEYARSLNFTNVDDFYALEEFYKTISHEILYSVLPINRTDATFLFSPCVERDTEGDEFLTDSPVNILQNGDYVKLPMLYGFANMEGLIREPLFEEWKDKMSNKFSDFLPPDLQFADEAEKEEVANKIRKFYFGDGPINDEKILNYIDYFSDIFFAYATLRSVKLHVEAGNNQIYLYEYSFVHDETPPVSHTNVRGAAHCMQSAAIADGNFTHSDESLANNELKEMKKLLRDLWFNFVKTGRPVPEGSDYPAWPPVGEGCSPHMIINKPLKLGGSLLKERTAFLDEIYDKHSRHPSPPPNPPLKRIEL